MIYMDNGATSYPKPPEVLETFIEVMRDYCANPGRAGHYMAARAAREIYKTRLEAARLFGIEEPGQVVFTKNCTEGLNAALKGVLKEGDHVITSSMEHNSVVRPLYELKKKGIETTFVDCSEDGSIDVGRIAGAIRKGCGSNATRMIVITAASNVTGTKMPLEKIGRLAVRNGLLFMVDGAQAAGHSRIDVRKQHIDILAVPGHKGLMGPQGTGMLYVRRGIDMQPLITGGTGSRSFEKIHPGGFPESYEAGTVNTPGIIALGTALRTINKIGVDVIEEHERRMMKKLTERLKAIKGVVLYGPEDCALKTATAAINIEGMDCEEAAAELNDRYGIAVRAGFHCAPMAHETIGTAESGCVRICPGFYTSEREIEYVADAVECLAASAGSY